MPARKTKSPRGLRNADIEIAAGGLVVHSAGGAMRIGIVRRTKYNDWALPKGRQEPGERIVDTAAREVGEELGCRVRVGKFAGSYGYEKDGRPKVILIWYMTRTNAAYPHPASTKEIREVAWLPPSEAIARLSYATEKEFVAQHSEGLLRHSRRIRGGREARKA